MNRSAPFALSVVALLAIACGPAHQQGQAGTGSTSGSGGNTSGSTGGTTGSSGETYQPGPTATAQIGPAGGTLSSLNGRVDLVVPAGALSADTAVTIQTVEVTEPDGSQFTVYELGPDGSQFQAGAYPRLVLHYTDKDLLDTTPELLGARFQNPDGSWTAIGSADLDTASKTVSVPLPHFSKWVFKGTCQILGAGLVVFTDDDLRLQMLCDAQPPQAGVAPFEFVVHDPTDPFAENLAQNIHIQVNDIEDGNAEVGTAGFAGANSTILRYHAPSSVPAPGTMPITLTWEVGYYDNQGHGIFGKTLTRTFKAASRSWTLLLKQRGDRQCGGPVIEECSYYYDAEYAMPIAIQTQGAHDYSFVHESGDQAQPYFNQLQSCLSYIKCSEDSSSPTTGVLSANFLESHYSDTLDQLQFKIQFTYQDFPTYVTTDTRDNSQQTHSSQGQVQTIFTSVGPLEDGSVRDTSFQDANGAVKGAIWVLQAR